MGHWKVAGPQRIQFDGEVRRLEINLARGRVSVVGTPGAARLEVSAVGRKLGSGGGRLDATSTSGSVALLAGE